MSKVTKFTVAKRFLAKVLSGSQQQILTTKSFEEKDKLSFSDNVIATVTECLTVTIGIGSVTLETGKEGEQPYEISNRETFAQASGFDSFEDLKNYIAEEELELPAKFTLIRWNASAFEDKDGESTAKGKTTTTKTAAQKAAEKAAKKEKADKIAAIDADIAEIVAEIAEAKKEHEAETDPVSKKTLEDQIAKLETEKADFEKMKAELA